MSDDKKMDRLLGTTREEQKKELMDKIFNHFDMIETISKLKFENSQYQSEEVFNIQKTMAVAQNTIECYARLKERLNLCDSVYEMMALNAVIQTKMIEIKGKI